MKRCLLSGVTGETCVAAILDEERGSKGVSSQNG